MKSEFYDVKAKAKITAKVIEKVTFGEGEKVRYALKGRTDDGRSLTRFVSKKDFDAAKI